MKKTTGFILLLMVTVLFFSLGACRKNCDRDFDNRCGNKECKSDGTVAYIPAQCGGFSDQLGILSSDGKYISVCEDNSGKFSTYKEGDKIKYSGETVNCVVCEACTCPSPDGFIKLSCSNSLSTNISQ
jgi:hypothetical protein